MAPILIVDDNPAVLDALSLLLEINGFDSICVESPEEAIKVFSSRPVSLVIQDMNFTEGTTSGEEGIQLFKKFRDLDADLPVVLLTAWAEIRTAVALTKLGASDYLAKPWDDDKLIATVQNLVELRELQFQTLQSSQIEAERIEAFKNIDLCGTVFSSPEMSNAVSLAAKVAKSDVSVLITGPNGSGKEHIANIVHANSARKNQPFVAVNMGALPEELMEAELFGAVAGAYTGATKARIGRFEAADGGTLFLDEIGNLSLDGQMKLLRVLQTGEFQSLGSSTTKRVDVRVLSATNADLEAAIKAGSFRSDLYYRLNVISVDLKPLSDRKSDVIPLAKAFLGIESLPGVVERGLCSYGWPGNVRELQNACQRAKVLAIDEDLSLSHFGLPASLEEEGHSEESIRLALRDHQGVVARAARSLGLTRQSFYRRMEKFGIEA